MEILNYLRQVFLGCSEGIGQDDKEEPILEREEISPSEIPEAVEAFICKIRGLAAQRQRPLKLNEIMRLLEDLPDVEGNGSGDADLLFEAMNAVDALVRDDPKISLEWYKERVEEDESDLGSVPESDPFFSGVPTVTLPR